MLEFFSTFATGINDRQKKGCPPAGKPVDAASPHPEIPVANIVYGRPLYIIGIEKGANSHILRSPGRYIKELRDVLELWLI